MKQIQGSLHRKQRARFPGRQGSTEIRSTSAGLTLVEIAVAMTILVLALLGFSRSLVASSTSTQGTQEVAVATQAGRRMIETLQEAEFSDVFALYNSSPEDDPEGLGTAPGHLFDVAGLDLHPDDADGSLGEIIFPEGQIPGRLREDLLLRQIGMPRDLDGDGVAGQADVSQTYLILPVMVRIEWLGKGGHGKLEFKTILTSY